MRIAYVTETYPPEVNGVALTAARTVAYLRERGHEVGLVRPRQSVDDHPEQDSDFCTYGCPIPMYPDMRFGVSAVRTLQARWRQSGVQLVHVATQGPLGWAAVSAARRLELPVTCDFRTNFHQYARYYGLGWIAPLVQSYLRRFHARARLNFVPTGETLGDLSAVGFERLRVVGRGVDTQRFGPQWRSEALRQEWHAGVDPVMLYVGRLAAEKNVGLALRAFRAARRLVPQLSMVVVGDGPLRPSLQHAFPDVRFVGPLRGDALARHYASADFFVFPSLSDTFGNVTMEALASGLPVVAFNTAAAGQHVENGVSGRLVQRDDGIGFIDAVCDLARRHHRLESMRVAAHAAAQRADWDTVMLAFEQQLQGAIDAQPARTAEVVALA